MVLERLLKAVTEVKMQSDAYDSILQSIRSRIRSLNPSSKRIEEVKQLLAQRNEEIQMVWKQIQEGEQLILKCSSDKPNCCSCFSKPRYLNELKELDNSLNKFCDIVMRETYIEAKETHDGVDKIHEDVKDMKGLLKDIHGKIMKDDPKKDERKSQPAPVSTLGKEVEGVVSPSIIKIPFSDQQMPHEISKVNEFHKGVKETSPKLGSSDSTKKTHPSDVTTKAFMPNLQQLKGKDKHEDVKNTVERIQRSNSTKFKTVPLNSPKVTDNQADLKDNKKVVLHTELLKGNDIKDEEVKQPLNATEKIKDTSVQKVKSTHNKLEQVNDAKNKIGNDYDDYGGGREY